MSDEHKPITDEELAAIQGRLNAAFIANAPDDIARLLAEVERLDQRRSHPVMD